MDKKQNEEEETEASEEETPNNTVTSAEFFAGRRWSPRSVVDLSGILLRRAPLSLLSALFFFYFARGVGRLTVISKLTFINFGGFGG